MYEIERKFLLDTKEVFQYMKNFPLSMIKILNIKQVYIINSSKEEVRIRETIENSKSSYVKTTKKGKGIKRYEKEEDSSIEIFSKYINAYSSIVSKTRYIIDDLEIDIYPNGLAILEKEYKTVNKANNDKDIFSLPFIKKEVTGDDFYSNASIAKRG